MRSKVLKCYKRLDNRRKFFKRAPAEVSSDPKAIYNSAFNTGWKEGIKEARRIRKRVKREENRQAKIGRKKDETNNR